MRRLIIGAVALVTGLLAAGGIALTTRRRRDRDEALPLDATPPLGTGDPADMSHASVEADFGPAGVTAETGTPAPAKRKRTRRKPAKAAAADAITADATDASAAADPTPGDPALADPGFAEPAPAESVPAAVAEAAEIAAAAEAAELSETSELPSAS